MSNLSVNAIRFLGIDAINKANSGHPGVVMGAALWPIASLQSNFVSIQLNQTGSTAIALFFQQDTAQCFLCPSSLSGFEDVSMDEVKNFRQWGSKTPGHPEFGHTAGVDANWTSRTRVFNRHWFCPSRTFLSSQI